MRPRRAPLPAALVALALAACAPAPAGPSASMSLPSASMSLPSASMTWPTGAAAAAGAPSVFAPAEPATPRAAARGHAPAAGVDRRAILELAPGAGARAAMATPALAGCRQAGAFRLGGRELVRVVLPDGDRPADLAARLAGHPDVRAVLADPAVRLHRYAWTNRDPLQAGQWAHRAAHADAESAWAVVPIARQAKTVVAVVDTGLDVGHPAFAGRVVAPRTFDAFATDPTDVTDHHGHGTGMAGVAAARGDDGEGGAGLAWGAKIMPLQVDDYFAIAEAVTTAVRWRPVPDDGRRVRVVNLSLGYDLAGTERLLAEAFAEARAAGVVVVVAAGNDGGAVLGYPASLPQALAVGATGQTLGWERLAPFSTHGPGLDLVAPGEDVLTTTPRDHTASGWALGSGTSPACAFVTGTVALMASRYDQNNARMNAAFVDAVHARLLATADDLGEPGADPSYGAGRVNVRAAVAPPVL